MRSIRSLNHRLTPTNSHIATMITGLLAAALSACSPGGGDPIPIDGGSSTQKTVGGKVPLTIVTPDLKGWVDTNGRYFTVQTVKLQAFGGEPRGGYSWKVTAAQPLPFTTLTLDADTGVFSGTLPANAQVGRYNFSVEVSDGTTVASGQFSLLVDTCSSTTSGGSVNSSQCHVNDPLNADPGSAADIIAVLYANNSNLTAFGSGNPFGYTLPATGGKPPYTNWRLQAGSLPPGIQLDSVRGVLYGTPAQSGEGTTYTFAIATTDTTGVSYPATGTAATRYSVRIGKP